MGGEHRQCTEVDILYDGVVRTAIYSDKWGDIVRIQPINECKNISF